MPRISRIRLMAYTVVIGMSLARAAVAQDTAGPARTLAPGPLTAIPAEEQIRLALSAAPPEVTARASVYVLGGSGYTRTRAGTNGFSCLVERELLETVEPVCYDVEGSATTLLARLEREALRARGVPEDEVRRRIDAGYREGRLRAPRKPGIVYMLAPEQRSWDPFAKKVIQAPPHFMLYAPFATQADLGGAPGPKVPVVAWPGQPDALMIIMAPGSHPD